jgi:hypothetical protein
MMIQYLLLLLNQPGLLPLNKVRVYQLGKRDMCTWMRCFHLVRDKGGVKKKGGKEAERGTKADIMLIHHRVEANMVVIHNGVEADLVVETNEVEADLVVEDHVVEADLVMEDHGVEADLVMEDHGVEADLVVEDHGVEAHLEVAMAGIGIIMAVQDMMGFFMHPGLGPSSPGLYTYATHSQPFQNSYPCL